jgi:ribosomal protein S18 acetylase RimI-like enzyme
MSAMSDVPHAKSPFRKATKADLDVVARTLGRAFADDPVWLWVMGSRTDMARRTGRLMAALAKDAIATHDTVLMSNSGEAVAVWVPPGDSHISLIDQLKLAPATVRALGLRELRKIPALTAMDKLHPKVPHWYLMILGADPNHQRSGFGRMLVEPMLERADDDGVVAYLESSKEANVPYYRRFGFEVTREQPIAPGGPMLWLMERPPR